MHELAQISDNTQQHQLRFRTAFRTTMFVFAPGHSNIDLALAHNAQSLTAHARVVLEKNREVELCEFCQIDVRVYHIDEICVQRRWRESYDACGVLNKRTTTIKPRAARVSSVYITP